jgi:hypothetical protein
MSETQFIDLTFPNGETWRITAYPIAEERAYFFIDSSVSDYEKVVKSEIDYVLSPDGFDELITYIEQYGEWNSFKKILLKRKSISPSYDEWLLAGQFKSEVG